MNPPYIVVDKKLGQTPLQVIEAWMVEHPEFEHLPATYAGRLDPMAIGKLLILLGTECKRKDAYIGLDKKYEIEVLLDFSTDTGDVLGIPSYAGSETRPTAASIKEVLKKEIGTKIIPYPSFSSKTVNGKPLFLYSLEGTLDTIPIPTHEEKIYTLTHVETRMIGIGDLKKRVIDILSHAPRTHEASKKLGADFRQDEITSLWQRSLSTIKDRTFMVLTIRVTCASGTYMRTLAARIGKELGTQAVALSIHRTRVGRYRDLPLGLGVWTRLYR